MGEKNLNDLEKQSFPESSGKNNLMLNAILFFV